MPLVAYTRRQLCHSYVPHPLIFRLKNPLRNCPQVRSFPVCQSVPNKDHHSTTFFLSWCTHHPVARQPHPFLTLHQATSSPVPLHPTQLPTSSSLLPTAPSPHPWHSSHCEKEAMIFADILGYFFYSVIMHYYHSVNQFQSINCSINHSINQLLNCS